jgi:hypothetical protein
MSTSHLLSPRRSDVVRAAWLVVGVLVVGVLLFGGSLAPWVVFWIDALVVTIIDLLGLSALARRSTRRTAIRGGVVGLGALIVQAGGLYASAAVLWNWLAFRGSGWLFWTLPVLAALLGLGLVCRRTTRLYAWAVLIGSAEGFLAFVAFLAAAFAACNCWD